MRSRSKGKSGNGRRRQRAARGGRGPTDAGRAAQRASGPETARESLAQTIGAGLETKFATPEELPEPPLPGARVATLAGLPRRTARRLQLPSQKSQSPSSLAPRSTRTFSPVNVFAAFGNQTSPTGFVNQQNQITPLNADARASKQDRMHWVSLFNVARGTPGFWDIGATSTLSLPIINYGARSAAHHSANQAIDSAQLALDSAKTEAEAEVRESLRSAQTSQRSADLPAACRRLRSRSGANRAAAIQERADLADRHQGCSGDVVAGASGVFQRGDRVHQRSSEAELGARHFRPGRNRRGSLIYGLGGGSS